MKHWIPIACLLLAPGAADAAPALVIDPPLINLGVVEDDRVVPFVAMFQNMGDAPLNISGVSTTCGCTVVNLADTILAPGQSTPLTGSFNTRKLEGDTRKTIFIECDDPKRQRAVLEVRSWIVREFSVSPARVDFRATKHGAAHQRDLTCRSGSAVNVDELVIDANPELFSWSIEPLGRDGDFIVHLVLSGAKRTEEMETEIKIRTLGDQHEKTVPIYIYP